MKESIASKTQKLCESYLQDEISLKDFQFQLEPLLGSFNSMSKDDVEDIRKIINRLELIIYTIPELSQGIEVKKLIPDIFQYVENKSLNSAKSKTSGQGYDF